MGALIARFCLGAAFAVNVAMAVVINALFSTEVIAAAMSLCADRHDDGACFPSTGTSSRTSSSRQRTGRGRLFTSGPRLALGHHSRRTFGPGPADRGAGVMVREGDAGMTVPVAVVMDGDVTMDWNLACRSHGSVAVGPAEIRAGWRPGGLLAELVERIAAASGQQISPVSPLGADVGGLDAPGVDQSWALWSPGRGGGWRVERVLGVTRAADVVPARRAGCGAGLVVVDDAGLGFRDQPDRWPAVVAAEKAGPWLLVRTTAPVASGALWEHLLAGHRGRLVAVVSAEDLRRSRVQVSQGLSWERTAQDVAWELTNNPDVRGLAQCAHVVVQFGAAGAVMVPLSRRPGPRTAFRWSRWSSTLR